MDSYYYTFFFKPESSIPIEFFKEIADGQADNLETLVGIYIQEQTGELVCFIGTTVCSNGRQLVLVTIIHSR